MHLPGNPVKLRLHSGESGEAAVALTGESREAPAAVRGTLRGGKLLR
ncbi:hypothetical protein [Paenibacillus sp. FSL R10-2736]